jgi:hypothetical protein
VWARIASAILGIWLTAAPFVLGYGEPARTNDLIVGPTAAALAAIAAWEATSPLRWLNLILGLWLMIAPWVLGHEPLAALNSGVVGLLMATLAAFRARPRERIGGGWSTLWGPNDSDE